MAFAVLEAQAQVASLPPQTSLRTLHGQITSSGHEPVRGAIVQLRNDRSATLVTYITDSSGYYSFQRLDGGTDYEIWVMFRGHRSRTRSISKFDSHMNKIINFRVRTY
ncbi:MAG: carboxypeptidase-like regulatory domain-containing protein [Acidobacteriaceae bacterium]